jgi:hypothetical protein
MRITKLSLFRLASLCETMRSPRVRILRYASIPTRYCTLFASRRKSVIEPLPSAEQMHCSRATRASKAYETFSLKSWGLL